jgi:hypothetical protein
MGGDGSDAIDGRPARRARDWGAFEASVAEHAARLAPSDREALRQILYYDLTSEYDARHYSAYVHGLDLELSDAFLEMERLWAVDEARHYEGFRRVHSSALGWGEDDFARLSERRADFGPIAHLFRDEFTICCLGAYDELATVRAYRANLPLYDLLGPELASFIREVVGDEGWHFSRFLRVIRDEHAPRLGEAAAVVREIRETEGTPYGFTFVLDHDDEVWNDGMFDEAADVLLRRLSSCALART